MLVCDEHYCTTVPSSPLMLTEAVFPPGENCANCGSLRMLASSRMVSVDSPRLSSRIVMDTDMETPGPLLLVNVRSVAPIPR